MSSNISNLCRFCCLPNSNFTKYSVKEETVTKFISFVPSIDLDRSNCYAENICQLCFGKSKICADFIEKVINSQDNFKSLLKNSSSTTTTNIIDKIKQISGISFKKITTDENALKSQEIIICSDDETENLLEEVEPQTFCNIDEDDDISTQDEDSDEDFKPSNTKRRKSTLNSKKNEGVVIDTMINFSCGFCKESFTNFDKLASHMKAKNCFIEKFECKECNKEFKSKKNLNSHTQVHRKKPAKLICHECAKEFNSQFSLDLHIESTHRRVVKRDCIFRCTSCQEKFESHLDLLNHVKKHTQDKKDSPRLCEFCSKMCPNQRSYQAHISNHREKTFVCEVCNKAFSKSFQLKQHTHVHTGIKSFNCDICNRSYAKRDSLRVHKKRDH